MAIYICEQCVCVYDCTRIAITAHFVSREGKNQERITEDDACARTGSLACERRETGHLFLGGVCLYTFLECLVLLLPTKAVNQLLCSKWNALNLWLFDEFFWKIFDSWAYSETLHIRISQSITTSSRRKWKRGSNKREKRQRERSN